MVFREAIKDQPIVARIIDTLPMGTVRQLLRHRLSVIGISYLSLVIFVAVFAGVISPDDPLEIDPIHALENPSWVHPLGLDHIGRDQLTRLFYGARVSLFVGIMSVGYYRGILRRLDRSRDHALHRCLYCDSRVAVHLSPRAGNGRKRPDGEYRSRDKSVHDAGAID